MVYIYSIAGGACLAAAEIELLQGLAERHGHVSLLVESSGQRDAMRRELAHAGAGVGIEVTTPASWLAGLWELAGDGRAVVGALERQLLMASVLDGRDAEDIAPLRTNPGTVRMLCRMAGELLPYILDASEGVLMSDAERVVGSLMEAYADELASRGLVERCQAADALRLAWEGGGVLRRAHAVVLRDMDNLPAYLVDLLALCARVGEVAWCLDAERACFAEDIERAFGDAGAEVRRDTLGGKACTAPVPPIARELGFLEVTGPHARARAYADKIEALAAAAEQRGVAEPTVVVACPRPSELFDELAPRLAARGIASSVRREVRFSKTDAGAQWAALSDLAKRMEATAAGEASRSLWWPASELSDWAASPLSGAGTFFARRIDKTLRGKRWLDEQAVMGLLQSIQSEATSARKKMDPDNPWAGVPCVVADVVRHLRAGRPVSALKVMLKVACALPGSAMGSQDGAARLDVERSVLERALEVVSERAHALGVSQAVACGVLDGLTARVDVESAPVPCDGDAPAYAQVRFMTASQASELAPGAVDALLAADTDIAGYPLAHTEGPVAELASSLGAAPLEIEPIARLRARFSRLLAAPVAPAVLARVTHDRQAKDRYPAAVWTELLAAREVALGERPRVESVGEGDVVRDFDTAAGAGLVREQVSCLAPQRLGPAVHGYLLPRRRDPQHMDDPAAPLVPQQLSASQIESYLTCPLCWFISNRVRPARLDAGFGGMEQGNFVHDVLYRLHKRLIEEGARRVTPVNLEGCLEMLREVFDTVRAEHERGRTDSSGALVPLSATERLKVDQILPQLEAAVRYEAEALAPFAPTYLEYSFNELGVNYAGRPLGGRIDRVDVDAEHRAVVIDYKHRANPKQFEAKDPTVPNKKTGAVAAEDPDWLPEHTQTLIYAQALRKSALALDTRGAVYFTTKGAAPGMGGAVSAELAEEVPGDGRVPGLKAGFPNEDKGGTMNFDALLDRVEATVGRRLDALEAGDVAVARVPQAYCGKSHGLGFSRRDA